MTATSRRRAQSRGAPLLLVLPALALFLVFFAWPILQMALGSLHAYSRLAGMLPRLTMGNYATIAMGDDYRDAIYRTLRIALGTCVLSLLLGYPVALYTHAAPARQKGAIILCIISPLLIVFSLASSSFMTPALLGGGEHRVLSMVIYQQALVLQNWPLASAVAAVLMLLVLLILLVQNRLIGRGRAGVAVVGPLSRALTRRLLSSLTVLVCLFSIAPVIVVLIGSLTSAEFVSFPPPGLSLRWYTEFAKRPEFVQSIVVSLVTGGAAGARCGLAVGPFHRMVAQPLRPGDPVGGCRASYRAARRHPGDA